MGGMRLKCTDCKGIGFMIEAKKVTSDVVGKSIEIDDLPQTLETPTIKPHSKKVKLTEVKMEQPI